MSFLGVINYILKSSNVAKKIFILIIFSLVAAPVAGYGLRIVRSIRDGNDELPSLEFGDFGELFCDGLRVGCQIGILLIPSFVLGMCAILAPFLINSQSVFVAICALALIVGLLTVLVLAYYSPAVVCSASENDSWTPKKDKFDEIISAKRSMYTSVIIYSIVWVVILNLAGRMIPFVGFIVSAFSTPAQAYFCGMYMREIRGKASSSIAAGNVYDASAGNSEDIDYSHDHFKDLYDNSDY